MLCLVSKRCEQCCLLFVGAQAATGDAELDALMEEIGGDPAPPVSQEPAVEQPASKPKKKKKGKAAAAEEEDIDALLAELDGPADQKPAAASPAPAASEQEAAAAAEPAAETGKGKKKKKKGKGVAKEEEDLDAVLAELGMAPAAKAEAQPSTDAQPEASEAAPADEATDAATAEAAAEEDDDAAAAVDGKVCTFYTLFGAVSSVARTLCLVQQQHQSLNCLSDTMNCITRFRVCSWDYSMSKPGSGSLMLCCLRLFKGAVHLVTSAPRVCNLAVCCNSPADRYLQEMTAAEKKKAKKKAREKVKKAGGDADDTAAPAAAKKGGKKVTLLAQLTLRTQRILAYDVPFHQSALIACQGLMKAALTMLLFAALHQGMLRPENFLKAMA